MRENELLKDLRTFIDEYGKEYSYLYVPYHHMKSPSYDKSIWTVNREKEFNLFATSYNLYTDTTTTFNLYIIEGKAQPVGKGKNGSRETSLFLCRFINVRNNQGNPWHGYPINHMDQTRDRPSMDFYNSGPGASLCKQDLKRLKRGKPL